ncbi:MAG: GlmU family protein [Bacteroidetes bacterium]|nr:GlmU family protein [Bacteroidota bacterium]
MHICIFEDEFYKKLMPLVHFRPVYDLKCGITSLKDKITRSYSGDVVVLHSREHLRDVVKEKYPLSPVNEIPNEAQRMLFINGRLLFDDALARKLDQKGADVLYVSGDSLVAAWVSGKNLDAIKKSLGSKLITSEDFPGVKREEVSDVKMIKYPWELIHHNGSQLTSDFAILTNGRPQILGKVYEGVHLMNPSQIHIAEGAKVMPGVVLDAEGGPIYISTKAKVMPNAVIEGPAFVGENSVIKVAAKIYENTTIGETCKVGGEVEESIIHAFSNKQHEGFIGHAYLGEWVNIGADSNNSDLKNDYGNVKVYNDGKLVDTGSQFVGLTMGDHSKCGINSMFNTGTVVSVCCNVYGAGLPPKYVPAFAWGGGLDGLTTYRIDKALEVARRVMARRKTTLSEASERLFKRVFEMTKEERTAAGIKAEA